MRTRQEQSDDTRLQRARILAKLTFDELGDQLGVAGSTAERYCLEDGNERAIAWMGPGPAARLKAMQLKSDPADPKSPLITVDNFREPAEPPRKSRVKSKRRAGA